jgi:polyketide synthase-associated protein
MRLCQPQAEVDKALEAATTMSVEGELHRMPEEVEEGYLGNGNRGKVCWMDGSEVTKATPKDEFLAKCDGFISKLAQTIQPYCGDTVGQCIAERTPALLSLSLTDDEEGDFPPEDSDDDTLGHFLKIWKRSVIKVVYFLGPSTPSVTLDAREGSKLPMAQDSVNLDAAPGTVLVFRTSAFNYTCNSPQEFLSLTATFLQPSGSLVLSDWEGETNFLRFGEGPSAPPFPDNIEVVNLSSRLMACWDEPEAYRAGLYGGCDSGREIPLTRWNVYEYWEPDNAMLQGWQSSSRHQALVEGIELFDYKYFEIVASEARVMDPMQRHALEVGAQNLFKMGITKKVSNRNPRHGGFSVGLDKDDWNSLTDKPEGGSNVQAIISNRFSFIFNLRGPNYVADTACSSALCATHLAKFTLMDKTIDKIEFHVALGLHQCLSPFPFVGCSQSHMCSPIGRCLTFNATASGYMRGDGCSGMTLKYGNHEDERECIWRASMCGQNGRSATLTAPNGLAQEEVIMKSYREGKLTPPESCVWSCHGTGTSLGDPIEVGAVRKTQIKEPRDRSLMVLTNKTHTGHLEGGAAMTSLIAAVMSVKCSTGIPINHFNQLNPHLENSQFDAFMNSEPNGYLYGSGNVHVSSFGFGGTNGHVIFWGQNVYDAPDVPSQFAKKLKKMAPPEVRVNGADPGEWEYDGPDVDIKTGDKYKITLRSDDPKEAATKWVKEVDGGGDDDDADDFYCVTGPFNEYDTDRMEEGAVPGLRTITLEVPESGSLEFRFLRNGEEEEALYPIMDKCTRKIAPILGPGKETGKNLSLRQAPEGAEKHLWLVQASPGALMKIELFVSNGMKSVTWSEVGNSGE